MADATATGKQMAEAPREEDLKDLEEFRAELQTMVDKARDDGRIYMMKEYTLLVAHISPEIKRIRSRFERETLAAFRKEHNDLKAIAKAERKAAKEAAENAAAHSAQDANT